MKIHSTIIKLLFQLTLAVLAIIIGIIMISLSSKKSDQNAVVKNQSHWLLLHRKSNVEFLYSGIPGDKTRSKLLKTFQVKGGIPGERPTPLPKLVGREYWKITGKVETKDSEETAPYFLILDVPYSEEFPYGPTPYLECGGTQCDWIVPGSFGLHGINGDPSRVANENPGSSGCVRHRDEDITYLYNLFDPEKEEIRYYIEDI